MKHEAVQCNRCSKPVYPVSLLNRDRKTWCGCDKTDVPDGWSGYAYKKKWKNDS